MNNLPAFPCTNLNPETLKALRESPAGFSIQEASRLASYNPGMTLRDYFAAAALTGYVAHRGYQKNNDPIAAYSEASYALADAMLKERERNQTT